MPQFRSVILVLPALLVVIACSACGAGSSKGTSVTPRVPSSTHAPDGRGSEGAGSLIVTRQTGLFEFDISTGSEKPLVVPETAATFVLDPSVSPDNSHIAYVAQPPPDPHSAVYDAGSDVWIAQRDGSNPHRVLKHDTPNQLVRFTQWQDNGHILAVVQEPSVASGTTSVVYVLERIDAGSGERSRLIEGVLGFGIAPDRQHIVYAKLAPTTGETLETAAIDGGSSSTLIGPEQNLAPFNSPRYSPDGSSIAFASADQTGAVANAPLVTAAPISVDALALDGLPEDIWTVPSTGGVARRIADLKEDLPAVTWDGDGTHLYVLGSNGLSAVTVGTGAIQRIGEGAFHGQLAWAP